MGLRHYVLEIHFINAYGSALIVVQCMAVMQPMKKRSFARQGGERHKVSALMAGAG